MNIVYDHQIFGWQQYGGISRYFHELASRVGKSEGFSATVVAPLYVNRYLSAAEEKIRGIRIAKMKRSGRILGALNGLLSPPFIRAAKPDLLHETYYAKRGLAPAGCPTVLTVFDMTHEKFPAAFLPRDDTAVSKRAAVRRAERVICISENTRRDLIDILGVAAEKTSVVHLGFNLSDDQAVLPNRQRPYFLYVGVRGGYKNFERLLEAFAAAKALNSEYDLVAFGGGPLSAPEREFIRSLGLQSAVSQLGGSDALLAGLYRQATAFVYPSRYEGFGIPLLEAMSAGCPVICSAASSFPEVAGDAARYFDPDDAGSLESALEEVAGSKEVRAEMIRLGRKRTALFSWDSTAKKTMEIYKDLIR